MVINTMRRAGAVFWLALAVVQFIPAITINTDNARLHAEALRNTYPRPEGSEGERNALEYVGSVLDPTGANYTVRDFADLDDGHSFSRMVDISIRGRSPETLLLMVPLSHPDTAGPDEDGSASLAATLALVEAAARGGSNLSFRIVILGAEHGTTPPYPLGSRLFLRDYFPDSDTAALYLDANQPFIVLETGGGGEVAPSWLLAAAVDSARAAQLTPRVRAGLNQLHRMGISSAPEPLVELLRAGIPAIHLGSQPGEFGPASVADSAAAIARLLQNFVTRFESDIPSDWDRHYLYFQLGRRHVVVPENVYLIILLGVVFGALLYALIARRQLGRYIRTIARNFWNLPVLFLLIFAFLSAGSLLLDLFLIVRRFPTLWQHNPMSYVSLKLALSVLLFSLAAQLLRMLPLSKNGSFYSASALFVLFVDIILFSVLNLSFSYYFVWAFLLSFLFSILRHRILKLLTLITAPILMVIVAIEVLAVPELRVAEILLLSPRGNLVLSFVTLPFLLMLIRLDFLIRHPIAGRRSFALRMVTIGSAAVSVALLVFILVSTPYSPTNPQPIAVTERVDYESFTRDLTLSSPAPLGEFTISYLDETEEVSTGSRTWEVSSDRVPDVLSVRLNTADFLDRNQARLTVDAPLPLEEVEVLFSSEQPMTIYDADFPYRLAPDRLTAEIFIGRRPRLPLVINYTTTSDTAPRIEVIARSSVHPDQILVEKAQALVTSTLEIRTVLNP